MTPPCVSPGTRDQMTFRRSPGCQGISVSVLRYIRRRHYIQPKHSNASTSPGSHRSSHRPPSPPPSPNRYRPPFPPPSRNSQPLEAADTGRPHLRLVAAANRPHLRIGVGRRCLLHRRICCDIRSPLRQELQKPPLPSQSLAPPPDPPYPLRIPNPLPDLHSLRLPEVRFLPPSASLS